MKKPPLPILSKARQEWKSFKSDFDNNLLYNVHAIKNAQTIKTGEFEALTRIFTGQLMYVDTRDISLAPHLMMAGIWEEPVTRVFRDLVKPGDVIFDVGANFGYFGVIAGANTTGTTKIVFVEANPYLVPYLYKSLSVNGLSHHGIIENVAVSSKAGGKVAFNFLSNLWGSSGIGAKEWVKGARFREKVTEIKVKLDTIDNIAKRNNITAANVVKIDIEGFEDSAYIGMKKLIQNSPDLKMLIEFSPSKYKDPEGFFEKIRKDFRYVSEVQESGEGLKKVTSYKQVEKASRTSEFVMLLVSKHPISL